MLAHRQSVGLWPDEGGQPGEAEPPPLIPLDCSNGKRQISVILKSGHDSGFVIPFSREETITAISASIHCCVSFPPRSQPAELPAHHWERGSTQGRHFWHQSTGVSLATMGAFENLADTVLGFIRGGERLGGGFHTSYLLASFLCGDVCGVSCLNEFHPDVGRWVVNILSSVMELAPLSAGLRVASVLE